MLDNKLWIYSYRMGSESAIALADALDVYIIKHENSTFRGEAGKYILNWGAGTGVFNAKAGGATIFNTPQQIDLAVNKLDFFKGCLGLEAPRLPFWTTAKNQAEAWLSAGHVVIARTKLEAAKGQGLVVCKNPLDIPDAKLYTVKVSSTEEYRVYMFNGEVLDARVKLLAQNKQPDSDGMRYGEQYEFCPLRRELPEDVKEQARRAIKKTGLLTGGVDVLFDSTTETATVLEVNTAPYVGEGTAEKYAEALKTYIRDLERTRRAA